MRDVLLSASAERDLISIWQYISRTDETAADRWIDRIAESLFALAGEAGMGSRRPDLGTGLRTWSVGRYVIIYRPKEPGSAPGIEVARVLHGARDLPSLFRDLEG